MARLAVALVALICLADAALAQTSPAVQRRAQEQKSTSDHVKKGVVDWLADKYIGDGISDFYDSTDDVNARGRGIQSERRDQHGRSIDAANVPCFGILSPAVWHRGVGV